MNIKGVFQIWMRNGDYHEVPLKECHAWTREGCKLCPDFAAEHADISTGGIGAFNDWTLTIVRTDIGREIMVRMQARHDRGAARRRRPGRDRPAAEALAGEPQAVAGDRGGGASPASPPPRRSRARAGPDGVEPGVLRDGLTLVAGVGTGVLSGAFGVGGAVSRRPAIRALGASATISRRHHAALDPSRRRGRRVALREG